MEIVLGLGLFLLVIPFVRRLRLSLLVSIGLSIVLAWFIEVTVIGVVQGFISLLTGSWLSLLLALVALVVLVGIYAWGRKVIDDVTYSPPR